MYGNRAQPTGLAPEISHFNMDAANEPSDKSDLNVKPLDKHYLLRPETIEALFYMYRITGECVIADKKRVAIWMLCRQRGVSWWSQMNV